MLKEAGLHLTNKDILLNIAMRELGKPYIWGGDDFNGRDCSGFVLYLLQSIGLYEYKGDNTAHGLYTHFKKKVDEVSVADEGDLVFWWNKEGDKVIHIEMALNKNLCIGASGGGSKTVTSQDAARDNAYLRVRPIKARGGKMTILKVGDLI